MRKFILLLLSGAVLFFQISITPAWAGQTPKAVQGLLDLRQRDWQENGMVQLLGEWEVYANVLIAPGSIDTAPALPQPVYKNLPIDLRYLTDHDSNAVQAQFATLRLKILLPPGSRALALKTSEMSCAHRLYLNGKLISSAGRVAKTRNSAEPGYRLGVFPCFPKGEILDIQIQISNFYSRHGGIWQPFVLGPAQAVLGLRERQVAFDIFVFGALLFMGIYHLVLFGLRRDEPLTLYFGAYCLLLGLRTLVINEHFLSAMAPGFSWLWQRRIEYLGIYLGLPMFTLFLNSLYPEEMSPKVVKAINLIFLPLSALTLMAPETIFAAPLEFVQWFLVLCGGYFIFILALAALRKKDGANLFLLGVFLFFCTVINDILYAKMIVNTAFVAPFGLVIFTFFQSVLLSRRFSNAFQSVAKLSDKLSRIFQNSPAGIFQATPGGQLLSVNPALAKIYHYESPQQMMSEIRNIRKQVYADPLEYARFAERMENPGWVENFECRHVRKDGEIIHVSINAACIRNDKGEVLYYDGLIEDISEKKRAVDLEIAKKAAEEANATKSEFLANMSHEIRTPMNGIIGMNRLLLDTELTEEQREYANIVQFSSDALLVLLNDILDFSKIESGKMELEIINIDIRKIIEDVAELMAIKAEEKGVEFGCLIDPEVPSLIKGDPTRIRQILLNLTGNAVKFTEKGNVSIRASLAAETDENCTIRFEVRDTGIGIDEKGIQSLFKTFSQADASTSRKYGGSGLGLAISKKLVEMMKGQIRVTSQVGKGSVFGFAVPFELQHEEKDGFQVIPGNIQGKSILIVDDKPLNIEILSAYLNHFGCQVLVARSGARAITMIQTARQQGRPIEAIITDFMMPGMDGDQVGEAVREDPSLRDTKLIMLSSRGLRGDAEKLKSIGFDAFLSKPIKRDQLLDCLQTVFGYVQTSRGKTQKSPFVTAHSIEEARKKSIRILLAEDNRVNQMLALKYLKKFGFRADAVDNGQKAVAALRENTYSLVLMDVQMPEMDGLEATRMIRKNARDADLPDVPIIAMTAHAMKEDRQRCLDAGMNDYISKPIDPQHLLEKINQHMASSIKSGK